MEVHEEQRKNTSDRRMADTAEFPLQDQEGTWVVTERRQRRGRRSGPDGYMARTGLITPILSGGGLLLAGVWVLMRYNMINTPSWLPVWILYPEILIEYLH